MAKEAKDNKKLIICICSAVVAIIAIVVIAIVIIKNTKPVLNDDFFKSDDTKLVITIDGSDTGEYSAVKQHQVYNFSGDKITGLKSYAEFANADEAKLAYDNYKSTNGDGGDFSNIELDGKYIILTISEEQYKDLTTSAVKQYIELFESLKNINLDDEE